MLSVLTSCVVVGLCEPVLSGTILFRGSSKVEVVSDLQANFQHF